MKKTKTNRGFTRYEFKDGMGDDCSLQKSSCSDKDYIWLGLDLKEMRIHHLTAQPLGCRMHIDRKLAAKLALKLAAFAETGQI